MGEINFTAITTPPPAAGTLIGARSGLSVDASGRAILGAPPPGTAAVLLAASTIPLGAFNLQIGTATAAAGNGQIIFQPSLFRVRDILASNVITFFPTRNTTVTGNVGQYLSNIGIVNTVGYTSPASTGQVVDYSSNSLIRNIDGAVSSVAFGAKQLANNQGGTGDCISFFSDSDVNMGALATGRVRGFYHKPIIVSQSGALAPEIAFENETGDNYFNSLGPGIANQGRSAFGIAPPLNILGMIHIGPGDGNPGNGAIHFDAGLRTAAGENGTLEYDGTDLWFKQTAKAVGRVVIGNVGTAAPATTAGVAILNFYGTSAANFLGQPVGWLGTFLFGTLRKIPYY